GSYHQGNIWPWLFGHFFDAMYKLNKNDESIKDKIKILLNPMEKMIMNYWDGNIPEILEGNWPYNSKGCFSQAWSVSEILRILIMAE
ncbi:MAG: glycogen debranching protein, partial [Thermotogae bacterium]|nr:glycogen debranching protein [Thermotogota bacterium]